MNLEKIQKILNSDKTEAEKIQAIKRHVYTTDRQSFRNRVVEK